MARAADGTMTLTGTFAIADTIPVSSTINGYISDILTELTDSWSRSGKGAALAHLSMGSFKLTTMADGVALTDAATVKQVQNRSISFIDGGGTADAITATYSPVVTAVVDGMVLLVEATAANTTTTPTFAPNGLTARTIKKLNGAALAVGDIAGDGHVLELEYHATSTYWNLLNPATAATVSGIPVSATSLAASTTFALTGDISPAQITADQNDYAPTGHATASVFRLSTDASRAITGLAGGADGRIVHLLNIGSFEIVLEDEATSASAAANRFKTADGSWVVIYEGGCCDLIYDSTAQRWFTRASNATVASQSLVEAATSVASPVVPARQQFHPSACKFWVESLANSTTIELDYNVDSVADTATGAATYTITNDFSSVDWACQVSAAEDDLTLVYSTTYDAKAAGSVIARRAVEAGSGADPSAGSGNASWSVCGFGDL